MKHITVFCASSESCDPVYFESSTALGTLLAREGYTVVFGGGRRGLMGHLADAALAEGGEVIGYIPGFMRELEWQHTDVRHMHIVNTMAERKDQLITTADAIVCLPGGSGTLEEFFDALTAKRLGHFTGPIILVNIKNFYDPLITLLELSISEKFMGEHHRDMWTLVQTVGEVPVALKNAPPWNDDALNHAGV